jgi:hypothetical protein
MWAFSVAECGLDHDKFWDLSWYEWSLYARRHKIHIRQLEVIEEGHWARYRIQWADFRNANPGKNAAIVKPQDLIKLSFDTDDTPEEKMTFKQAKERLGSRLNKNGSK